MVEGENETSSKLLLDELITKDSKDSSYVAKSCAMIIAHTGFSTLSISAIWLHVRPGIHTGVESPTQL